MHLAVALGIVPKEGKTRVAVKTLKGESSVETARGFRKELEIMMDFDHPKIIKLFGVCTTEEPLYLITELMTKGDLKEFFLLSSTQHQLQDILYKSLFLHIKNSGSVRNQARLNAISTPLAGSWLRAIPNRNLGLVMSAEESVIALRLWLGISVFPPFSSSCPCGSIIDSYGDHVLGCGSGNLRIERHDALCDIVFHTLLEDHSGTRRE